LRPIIQHQCIEIILTSLSFSTLSLPPAQIENLTRLGYQEMTAIQAKALPSALLGNDIIGQAKTGGGKTAAFGIPLLNKLNPRDFGAQALIICPTRELATQVAKEIRNLARYQPNIKVVTLCGGQSIGPQIGSLEHGAHVIVGTPGRLKDHLRKKTLSLARATTLVLDEADRMLEMGFVDDIEDIIKDMPAKRQTLLFSATFPENIQQLSAKFQTNPQQIVVESIHSEQHIEQLFFLCNNKEKRENLLTLLHHYQPNGAVVFCNTKQTVRDVCEFIANEGISVKALHGDMEQRDRDQVLIQFKQQSCQILVATDVAARGLDIDDLPAVVNFEMPRDPDTYTHRIGRTGRAGKSGLAINLFTDSERYKIEAITAFQDRKIDYTTVNELPDNNKYMQPPAYATLCISAGRKQKVRPGDILGAITKDAGIDGSAVGKIEVLENSAYVAIEQHIADKALGRLINGKIKGRKFKVRKL
jgi:ATP-independent RNA helicase DbpA